MRKYPIKYSDKFGTEEGEIHSDGSSMYLTLRGIQFEGSDFEGLEGEVDESKFQYQLYKDGSGDLFNFRMEIQFHISLQHENKVISAPMKFEIEVGEELEFDGLESIVTTVELATSFGKFQSNKKVEWFEEAIIEIQNKLPNNTRIKSCLNCKYSNYHPVGNGMYGSLYCFKKLKSKVSDIQNKDDLMDLWTPEAVKKNDIFNVQETFDCSEHQFITKQDWTYKDWDYKTSLD